jgi:glycosyltransferase involved in cell wall biosynthesis
MRRQPLVSALMVSRNNERFVAQAIQSVVDQKYDRWELIVVENGSRDRSGRIVREAAERDPRIRPHLLDRELALPRARNVALHLAAGEYIATIDGDDLWTPEKLFTQVELMERSDRRQVGVCGTNCLLIAEDGTALGTKRFPLSHEDCVAALWYRNPFCHSATLVRRSVFESVGGYDVSFEVAQDLELWFRAGRVCRFLNLPEELVRYRVRRQSVTFSKHRAVVRSTLRARRLAAPRYEYSTGVRVRLAMVFTWAAQWLPPQLAHWLFDRYVLGKCLRPAVTPLSSPAAPGLPPDGSALALAGTPHPSVASQQEGANRQPQAG